METKEPRSRPDEIARALRAEILGGERPVGSQLPPERELAAQLDTNRSTLREALRALETQGLVRPRRGAGVRVTDFRVHGELSLLPDYVVLARPEERARLVHDLLGLRTLLLVEIVSRACGRLDAEHIRRLDETLDALEANRRDPEALAETEWTLLTLFIDAADSLVGRWTLNSLAKVARQAVRLAPDLWRVPADQASRWREVTNALIRDDRPAAVDALNALLAEADAWVQQRTSAEPAAPRFPSARAQPKTPSPPIGERVAR